MGSFLNGVLRHTSTGTSPWRNDKELRHERAIPPPAEKAAHAVGSYWAFLIALLTIVMWALTGPYFNYSDTWQLFINTGTTIVTFLMVFPHPKHPEPRDKNCHPEARRTVAWRRRCTDWIGRTRSHVGRRP